MSVDFLPEKIEKIHLKCVKAKKKVKFCTFLN